MRKPCCEKGTNKGAWSKQEDQKLIEYIRAHGEGCWRSLPKAAGLQRCGKSCRLRWINYLRPDIKRGNFAQDEEDLIIKLHALLGNRWSLIAGRLPGRTDNEVKNYWNSHIKRKLIKMGIDPNNHKLHKMHLLPRPRPQPQHISPPPPLPPPPPISKQKTVSSSGSSDDEAGDDDGVSDAKSSINIAEGEEGEEGENKLSLGFPAGVNLDLTIAIPSPPAENLIIGEVNDDDENYTKAIGTITEVVLENEPTLLLFR